MLAGLESWVGLATPSTAWPDVYSLFTNRVISTVSPSPGLWRTDWAVPTVVMVLFSANNLHVSSGQLLGLCHFLQASPSGMAVVPRNASAPPKARFRGTCCVSMLPGTAGVCVLSEQTQMLLCGVSVSQGLGTPSSSEYDPGFPLNFLCTCEGPCSVILVTCSVQHIFLGTC